MTGIGRQTPETRGGAELPNPRSGRPTPPGGRMGGAPEGGESPRSLRGRRRDEHLEGTAAGVWGDARPRGQRAVGHSKRHSGHRPANPNDPR
jgi:hypothetical protein